VKQNPQQLLHIVWDSCTDLPDPRLPRSQNITAAPAPASSMRSRHVRYQYCSLPRTTTLPSAGKSTTKTTGRPCAHGTFVPPPSQGTRIVVDAGGRRLVLCLSQGIAVHRNGCCTGVGGTVLRHTTVCYHHQQEPIRWWPVV